MPNMGNSAQDLAQKLEGQEEIGGIYRVGWLVQRYALSGQLTQKQREWLDYLSVSPGGEIYRFAVQELLSEAALRRDRPLFEEMLARAEAFQRQSGQRFGILHQMAFIEIESDPFTTHFLYNSRIWIPPQHPWFSEIQAKLGEEEHCTSASRTYLTHGRVRENTPPRPHAMFTCNLPAHYAALVGGYWEQVKWFYKQGAYGQGWLTLSPGERPRVTPLRETPRACGNMLTAALYSGDFRLVRFVLERFPQIQPRREMLYPLFSCSDRLIARVLHTRLDFWKLISLKDVLSIQSPALLKAWLHRNPGSLPSGYQVPFRPRWKWVGSSKSGSRFYRVLIDHTADKDTRLRIFGQWLLTMVTRLKRPDCYPLLELEPEESEWLQKHLSPGMDLTPLLEPMLTRRGAVGATLTTFLQMKCPSDEPIREPYYKLDIYILSAHSVRGIPHEMLKLISPTRILPQPDWLTTKFSKVFTLAELVRMGFVTPVNLPHIRLSKRGPSNRDSDSLIILHKMAQDRAMTERYSFDGSGEE